VAHKSLLTLLALVVAGGLACADVDDWVDGGARRDAIGSSADGDVVSSLACAMKEAVQLDPEQADVMILLDRSGSMDTAFGSGTRYQAVASLLSNVASAYAGRVRFGYQELPGRQECGEQAVAGCCASPPTVGIAWDTTAAVLAAIAAAAPMDGSTPTAAALQAAHGYYGALADGIENRYVLLATDGAPNCTLAGALSSGGAPDTGACADARAEVAALVAAGVRVIVLGVGPDLADDTSGDGACLDAMAHAGGAAASPGSPGYYAASDPDQLQLAVEQIFGGVARPSCVLRFQTPVTDPSTIAVFLDGQRIPLMSGAVGNGWWLDKSQGSPIVRVIGAYCDKIEGFQVSIIEARFGCPPCIDVVECS
jgi:hypothetical protein